MTLRQLRKQFRTQSGRFDLVREDGTDSGADFYINAGMRYLDRLMEEKKSVGRVFRLITAGTYLVTFTKARSIYQVWAATQDVRRVLTKLDFMAFREKFYQPYGSLEQSELPTYYTPALLRSIPETLTQQNLTDLSWVVDFMDVMTSDHYAYNGVLIASPPSGDIMLEVVGLFYSSELSADTDENFWTVQHPEILLMAAMMQLEIVHRNKQGVADWAEAIAGQMLGVNQDFVDELATDVTQMKG